MEDPSGLVREPFRRALRQWEENSGRQLTITDKLEPGMTDARLYRVHVEGRGGSGNCIMKTSPPGKLRIEPRRHFEALDEPEAFVANHLVEVAYDPVPVGENGWIVFQRIAGGGMRDTCTFARLLDRREHPHRWPGIVEAVSVRILRDWNRRSNSPRRTAAELLTSFLGDRLGTEGTVRRWATASSLSIDAPVELIELQGEVEALINPFALMSGSGPGSRITVPAVTGFVHGDLHPGNIMVRSGRSSAPDEFWLVDLSRYRKDGTVAFDLAYLALTVVAHLTADGLDAREGFDLIDSLVEPRGTASELIDHNLGETTSAVWRAGLEWADDRSMVDEWRDQFRLGLVAWGVTLAARASLSAEFRTWAFRLAARAADRVVKDHSAGSATPARVAQVPTSAPSTGVDAGSPQLTASTLPVPATPRPAASDRSGRRRLRYASALGAVVLLVAAAAALAVQLRGGATDPIRVSVLANPDELVTVPALRDVAGNYVTQLDIAAVPPPPDRRDTCNGRFRWAHSAPINAIDAGASVAKIDITARGTDVKIDRAKVTYRNAKSEALRGTLLACPGRGGNVPPHLMQADLDTGTITFFPDGGSTPGNLDIRIGRNRTESILLIGYTQDSYARWNLELAGDDLDGNSFAVTIGPGGSASGRVADNPEQAPFETTAEFGSSAYRYRDDRWQPGR